MTLNGKRELTLEHYNVEDGIPDPAVNKNWYIHYEAQEHYSVEELIPDLTWGKQYTRGAPPLQDGHDREAAGTHP